MSRPGPPSLPRNLDPMDAEMLFLPPPGQYWGRLSTFDDTDIEFYASPRDRMAHEQRIPDMEEFAEKKLADLMNLHKKAVASIEKTEADAKEGKTEEKKDAQTNQTGKNDEAKTEKTANDGEGIENK